MAATDEGTTSGLMKQSGIGQLTAMLTEHLERMQARDVFVEKIISGTSMVDILRDAKKVALEQEKTLLLSIMDDIDEMTTFLKDIIHIENLFNQKYSPFKQRQEAARKKHAPKLPEYERKQKVQSETASFVHLVVAGQTQLKALQKWLDDVVTLCEKDKINIVAKSKAQCKNIERAFYKAFYVYAETHGEEGYKQMTDMLRCSLVFDNFDDLYKCFSIIEKMARADGGILRAKDRYHPATMPFGYRDLLLNVYCPGHRAIVCEIQLHFQPLYKFKKVSHKMYKRARLFERETGNLAYEYSSKYMRPKIGTFKVYEPKHGEVIGDDDDAKNGGDSDAPPTMTQLLTKWSLEQYIDAMTDDGYDDPSLWYMLTKEDLKEMGFKKGHRSKFVIKRDMWLLTEKELKEPTSPPKEQAQPEEKHEQPKEKQQQHQQRDIASVIAKKERNVVVKTKRSEMHSVSSNLCSGDEYGKNMIVFDGGSGWLQYEVPSAHFIDDSGKGVRFRLDVLYGSQDKRPLSVHINGREQQRKICDEAVGSWYESTAQWRKYGEFVVNGVADSFMVKFSTTGYFPHIKEMRFVPVNFKKERKVVVKTRRSEMHSVSSPGPANYNDEYGKNMLVFSGRRAWMVYELPTADFIDDDEKCARFTLKVLYCTQDRRPLSVYINDRKQQRTICDEAVGSWYEPTAQWRECGEFVVIFKCVSDSFLVKFFTTGHWPHIKEMRFVPVIAKKERKVVVKTRRSEMHSVSSPGPANFNDEYGKNMIVFGGRNGWLQYEVPSADFIDDDEKCARFRIDVVYCTADRRPLCVHINGMKQQRTICDEGVGSWHESTARLRECGEFVVNGVADSFMVRFSTTGHWPHIKEMRFVPVEQ